VGLPALTADFGVDIRDVIAGHPVDPRVFASAENLLPYGLITSILDRAARLTDCPHLGLLLGERHDHRTMGPAGAWLANAPTLEASLSGFIALQPTNTRGAVSYLHFHNDDVIFGYGAYDRMSIDVTQNYACVIAMAHNVIATITGGKVRPLEVLFSFRRPANAMPYADFFGVPVRFDEPQSGLVLRRADLATPLVGANPTDFEVLRKKALAMMPPSDSVWSDKVRRFLRTSLIKGEAGRVEVAKGLGLHPKTLSRHLAEESSSFEMILGEVRAGAAKELLAITDLSIGEVAMAMGYANQAAFSHAFQRWIGMTPSAWRQQWREQMVKA
jgi:AraC-like DNA-binding protein